MHVVNRSSMQMEGNDQQGKQKRFPSESACSPPETPLLVFTISGCCMSYVVKQLLFGLGVGPTIFELDCDEAGQEIHAILHRLDGAGRWRWTASLQPVPSVFVAGKYLGGCIETVMACHINGTLIPLLKDFRALWL